MKGNDGNHENLSALLSDCLAGRRGFTVSYLSVQWDDKAVTRPLVFKDSKTGGLLDNLADCPNTRKMFMYKPGFDGTKKRMVLIIEVAGDASPD